MSKVLDVSKRPDGKYDVWDYMVDPTLTKADLSFFSQHKKPLPRRWIILNVLKTEKEVLDLYRKPAYALIFTKR
jgi:hypothetical protein